jgi:hypothetical protein
MRFVTLGPEGTCHENATRHYAQHHGMENAEIILANNFFDALEMVHDGEADYLIQNSAHLNVHLVTEKYYQEIPVIDTFIYQTGDMALLEDIGVEQPQTLGLVQATEGYLNGITYPEMVFEVSKPVVGKNLLEGKYDAGLTYLHYYTNNPGRFRLRKYIGVVITAWLVYGREMTYNGEVMGALPKGFYQREDRQLTKSRPTAIFENVS